jgi:predicted hotdog family 3-hydroxylacyl-ACP dehydratase
MIHHTTPDQTDSCPRSIDSLVPHEGDMCLLDELLEVGQEHLRARVTPMRDDLFATSAGIPGWVGLEWMAQAIAAWSGHHNTDQGRRPSIGFLLGTRRYRCDLASFPFGVPVEVSIQLDYRADNGLGAFQAELHTAQGQVASALLNVFQPESEDALNAMLKEQP